MPKMIWTTGTLAVLAIAWTSSLASAADKDTVLLGGKSTPKLASAPDDTMNLLLTGDEDTVLTKYGRYYGGYGYGRYYGGYGRYYGGYGRYYGGFGYGGYNRGFGYSSFYRPYYGYPRYSYGFSLGYNYWPSYYYRPYYYGSYYSYNWAPSCYYYPISDIDQTAPVTTLEMNGIANGGYFYNGGPENPVPLPKKEGKVEPPSVPLEGRPVSLPAPKAEEKKSKFAYPAYGEEPGRTDFATDRKASKR